jgi:hypothetical protein
MQASIDDVLGRGLERFLVSLVGALDLVGDAVRRDFFYAPADTVMPAEGASILDDAPVQQRARAGPRAVRGADSDRAEGVVRTTPGARPS